MSLENRGYYGPYFWLSLAAFAMPIVVALAAFQEVSRPYTKPKPNPDVAGVDHNLWDYLLKSYVENGLIDYDGMKRDYLFKEYLSQLGAARPDELPADEDRLALLCNAYNAFVINGVITHEITDSVIDYKVRGIGFFDLEEHIFAGETVSLNHLEHEVIRPTYKDPRIHMALVCAAKSCPVIRAEAYTGPELDRQLSDQAGRFSNDAQYVHYDGETNTLHLSAILDWYGDDFGGPEGVLSFLEKRSRDETIKEALNQARDNDLQIAFTDYDWGLNAQATGSSSESGRRAASGFGSGSIPN